MNINKNTVFGEDNENTFAFKVLDKLFEIEDEYPNVPMRVDITVAPDLPEELQKGYTLYNTISHE